MPHEVGFEMPVIFRLNPGFRYNTVSDRYTFLQYVKDKWDIIDEEGIELDKGGRSWALDEYGYDSARGDWDSSHTTTDWIYTLGFVGSARLGPGQLLSKYQAEFYWVVKKGRTKIYQTDKIKLIAEGDDRDVIRYSTQNVRDRFTIVEHYEE